MKKFALGILVIGFAVITGFVLVAAWNTRSDSPVEVAQKMVSALERHHQADLQRTFCDPELAGLVLTATQAGIQFDDLRYAEVPHPTNGVVVTVSGRMKPAVASIFDAITWTLRLHKSDGDWCIMSLNTSP